MKSIVDSKRGQSGADDREAHSIMEEIRHLWTRMQSQLGSGQGGALRIGFVSSHPGEGATTMAANFAMFLGEQGRSVCLVEGNLRRPVLAQHFGVQPIPGLRDSLDGAVSLDEAMRPGVAPGVSLLPAGSIPSDPYAVLGRGGTGKLLENLGGLFEVDVIDIPPLSSAPEASVILRELDGVVLVVRAHQTQREAAQKSVATFEEIGVPFLGAVINRMTYDLPLIVERIL
jgi:capsular exopolysaccharide synthesis family protein